MATGATAAFDPELPFGLLADEAVVALIA